MRQIRQRGRRSTDWCSVFGFAEVKMAEYPASVVAASALLAAASEVAGAHLPAFQAGVAACPFVNSVSMITFSVFPLNPP
jgi:hypothetical protein